MTHINLSGYPLGKDTPVPRPGLHCSGPGVHQALDTALDTITAVQDLTIGEDCPLGPVTTGQQCPWATSAKVLTNEMQVTYYFPSLTGGIPLCFLSLLFT